MNLRSKMSIFTLVGAMMLVPMFSFSQGPQSPNRNRERENGVRKNTEQRMGSLLDLSDEQKDQAKKIRMSAASEILPLSNQVNEIEAKLKTLQTANEVDLKLVNKNIDEMARLNAEIHKIRAKSKQGFRAMLTEEQRVVFDTRLSSGKPGGQRDKSRMHRPSGRRH